MISDTTSATIALLWGEMVGSAMSITLENGSGEMEVLIRVFVEQG